MQFLKERVATVCDRFQCFKLVLAEYRRRASSQCMSVGAHRSRPIFGLMVQSKRNGEAGSTKIKFEKYNSVLNSFERMPEISLGDRRQPGVVLQKNKVYILGGVINGVRQKSVSTIFTK